MKLKGLLSVCIAVTWLSLFGCASTTYQKSNISGNNLNNIPGYRIITNKDENNSIFLQYAKLVRVPSLTELELDPHSFENKEEFIQASITHNPPLKDLPQSVESVIKAFIEAFPNGLRNKSVKLAFKTCDKILTNEYTYMEMCSYDYKNNWGSTRGITGADTDRVFFIGTFNQGKLVTIIMHNNQDFRSAYLAARNAYLQYDTPITIASQELIFKGMDTSLIEKSMSKHDKKIYTVAKKLPSNYKEQIDKWALNHFKDPDSVKYRWGISKPLKLSNLKTDGKEVIEYCFLSNAKAPTGGYTGYTLHKAFFEDGKLTNVAINNQNWNDNIINDLCNHQKLK